MADIPDSRGAGARLVGCGAGCQPGCGGAGHPRQAHPVQNSPGTPQNADFGPFSGCWANFVTLGLQTDHAGRTLYRMQNHFRDKTLPARPKTPILAHFPDAGRILSRSGCKQTTQGELCTAFGACAGTKLSRHTGLTRSTGTKLSRHTGLTRSTGTKLSPLARNSPFRRVLPEQGELFHARAANRPRRENFVPHSGPVPVQNSPSTYPRRAHPGQNSPGIRASRAQPVQNSPRSHPRRAHPVQNSPRTPQSADCGPLSARRESFIPLPPPTSRAGRRKSRTGTPPHPTNAPSPNSACNSIA